VNAVSKRNLFLSVFTVLGINLLLGLTAFTMMTAQAQSVTSICDPAFSARVQTRYIELLAAPASTFQAAALNNVRAELTAQIAACHAEIDGPIRYDGGGELVPRGAQIDALTSQYILYGNKWGANTNFSPDNPPGTPGGVVTYSFIPNGVDQSAEFGATTNVAIGSLPTFQSCFYDRIRAAFNAWETVAGIEFDEILDSALPFDTLNAMAHIRIGAHSFDGTGGMLAHAYYPPPNGLSAAGDVHFDMAENWSCSAATGFDIGIVALHEIGHSIGLAHEGAALAVMNPIYNPDMAVLQADDINGVRAIYGLPDGAPTLTPTPTQTVTPTPTEEPDNLIRNGSFTGTIAPWGTYDGIEYQMQGGVFEFYRRPGTRSAVVLQNTGLPVSAGTTLETVAWLGNSGSARKRVTLLIHDSDFSDLQVCSFWLPPFASMMPYTMRVRTTEAWSAANLSIYASSVDLQGFIRLDNVVLHQRPMPDNAVTQCLDPRSPEPQPGDDSPNLIHNPAFSAGMDQWITYGDIGWRIESSRFEFYRLPGLITAEVYQNTGAGVPAGGALDVSIDLGNSSGVRKRAQVVLHDADWSDVLVCAYWLPPNSPLTTYQMRTFTTEAWSDASVSVYAAQPDGLGWLQVDNLALYHRPTMTVNGTLCTITSADLRADVPYVPTLMPTATATAYEAVPTLESLPTTATPTPDAPTSGEGESGEG
jgi:hypothetical protein